MAMRETEPPISTNVGDAVSWVLLVVPCLMIPLGIVSAALVAVVARAIHRAASSRAL
jgi:hypothetical protein